MFYIDNVTGNDVHLATCIPNNGHDVSCWQPEILTVSHGLVHHVKKSRHFKERREEKERLAGKRGMDMAE